MTTSNKYLIAGLLVLSSVSLSVLIPGGAIETRSFSHINSLILGLFNTFLTSLGIISILLVYFVLKQKHWSFIISAVCGLSYFLVYGLDLAGIFPVSPDTMPTALLSIEIWGIVLSLPLMLIAGKSSLQSSELSRESLSYNHESIAIPLVTGRHFAYAVAIVLLAISIITFATRSAMGV